MYLTAIDKDEIGMQIETVRQDLFKFNAII